MARWAPWLSTLFPSALIIGAGVYYFRNLPRHNPWLWMLCPDDTAHTAGFRESEWEALSFGDKPARVLRLMGSPLSKRRIPPGLGPLPDGGEVWEYAQAGTAFECHFIRRVGFHPIGDVGFIFSGF